jgi:hypothetical protein
MTAGDVWDAWWKKERIEIDRAFLDEVFAVNRDLPRIPDYPSLAKKKKPRPKRKPKGY